MILIGQRRDKMSLACDYDFIRHKIGTGWTKTGVTGPRTIPTTDSASVRSRNRPRSRSRGGKEDWRRAGSKQSFRGGAKEELKLTSLWV